MPLTTSAGLTEKNWPSIILTPIAVDVSGTITVSSTKGLRTKQQITLAKVGLDSVVYEVKKVLTSTTFLVGPVGKGLGQIIKPTQYNGGSAQVHEQQRNTIGEGYVIRSVYEEEPVVALRVINVDPLGNIYDSDNPLPVTGSITVDTEIKGIYNALTNPTPDNVGLIGTDRNAAPTDADQLLRLTGITNGAGDVRALDVAIRDENGEPFSLTNPLPVFVSTVSGGTVKNFFNEVSSVAQAATTTIVSFTVPVGKTIKFLYATATGTNIARYDLEFNGLVNDRIYTYFSGPFNAVFDFSASGGQSFIAGDVIRIRVTHNRPMLGDFSGRIYYLEE